MPEIERKFLVTALPAGLGEGDAIAQGYLAIAPDGVETRIRRRAGAATLTVKSGPSTISSSTRTIAGADLTVRVAAPARRRIRVSTPSGAIAR